MRSDWCWQPIWKPPAWSTPNIRLPGIGPTMAGRNGGGDLYYTDGEVWVLRLVKACQKREGPVVTMPSPAVTEMKDDIWHAIAGALGN